ncbi:MAG: hypothetical protein ACRECZ_05160 [Methylocella sp.]
MIHDAEELNMALQANSASATAHGRSRIAIFVAVEEVEAILIGAAAFINIAAWNEHALTVPWGCSQPSNARVANTGHMDKEHVKGAAQKANGTVKDAGRKAAGRIKRRHEFQVSLGPKGLKPPLGSR